MYEKEVADFEAKIDEMKMEGKDEYDIKKKVVNINQTHPGWRQQTPPPPPPPLALLKDILAYHPSYGQRQQRPLNIVLDLLSAISSHYRSKKEVKKPSWKWFGHNFADPCVNMIMVCSKWDCLLGHRVVTTIRKIAL